LNLNLVRSRSLNAGASHRGYVLMRLIRPVGPYLAWVALKAGLGPRHVTYASFVLGWLILWLTAAGGARGMLMAMAGLLVWEAVDVTDGTMARALGTRDNFGGFVDYAAGIVIVAFLPLALGIGLYNSPDGSAGKLSAEVGFQLRLPPVWSVIVGAIVSVISLLMRLVNRVLFVRFGDSYSKWDAQDAGSGDRLSLRSAASIIVRNLETTGGVQALLWLLAAAVGCLELALAGYFVFYILLFLVFIIQTYRTYHGRLEYYVVEVRPKS
jgi:phosphatidylglycerophosphate synthase